MLLDLSSLSRMTSGSTGRCSSTSTGRICRSAEFRSAVVVGHAESREVALDAARSRLDELRDEFACFFTKRYIFWRRPNIETLETRLADERKRLDRVYVSGLVFGAWARRST